MARVAKQRKQEPEAVFNQALLSALPDGVVTYGADGQCRSANQAATDLLGVPLAHLLTQNFRVISSWQDSGLLARAEEVTRSGIPERWETHFTSTAGKSLWLDFRLERVDLGGEPTLLLIFADISERKQAEVALRKREEWFRTLIENVSDLITVVNSTGAVLFVSPSLERFAGCRPEDVVGHNVFAGFIHPDDMARVQYVLCATMAEAGLTSPVLEARLRHADGSWRTLEMVGRSLKDASGQMIAVVNSRDISERKQAEQELQIASHAIERAGIGVMRVDEAGRIREVNPHLCQLLGYSREELLSLTLFEVTVGLEARAWPQRWGELKERGPVTLEKDYRTKSGEIVPVEISVSIVEFDGEEYDHIFVRDISERKRAEEALKGVNERLSLATVAGGVGIWDLDVVNNKLTWDEQMFRLYGMEPDSFGGAYETWKARVHPDDLERGDAEVQMALRGEKEFDTEFRVIWPSGAIHHIRARAQVHRDAAGQPRRLIGTNYDITERRQMEESLLRTQFIVDHSHDHNHWVDSEGRFLYVNDASCRRLGYSREELLGMTVNDIDPIAPQPWSRHFQELRERGSFTFESLHQTKDGEIYPVEVTVNYVNYGGQEYSCAFVRDISERKRAEEDALESERRYRTLVRTPMTSSSPSMGRDVSSTQIRPSKE